jgi:hypothetical protein
MSSARSLVTPEAGSEGDDLSIDYGVISSIIEAFFDSEANHRFATMFSYFKK